MWRNPSGGFAAEDSRHRRRKGLPQATKQDGIAAEKAAKRQELLLPQQFLPLPGQRSLPGTFPYFLLITKSMKKTNLPNICRNPG